MTEKCPTQNHQNVWIPKITFRIPPVPFICKGYWFPKDEGSEQAYEDGYETDHATGRIAIADGVSSTIFSRSWANLLTRAATACPPDINDLSAVETWLAKLKKS